MPGTSQHFEMKMLDSLTFKQLEPARFLLNHFELIDLVKMLFEHIPHKIQDEFPSLTTDDWDTVVRKVCFTRITAIEVDTSFTYEELEFLLELMGKCYGYTGPNLMGASDIDAAFTYAQDWLHRVESVIRIKHHSNQNY